ncbi:hypothetical protein EUW85_19265 [Salmonella enterica subsp. enterica serovar Ngili]|nr:hypothetical protein [Salmonella enterica subsp. enterica serovar Ngili]
MSHYFGLLPVCCRRFSGLLYRLFIHLPGLILGVVLLLQILLTVTGVNTTSLIDGKSVGEMKYGRDE